MLVAWLLEQGKAEPVLNEAELPPFLQPTYGNRIKSSEKCTVEQIKLEQPKPSS